MTGANAFWGVGGVVGGVIARADGHGKDEFVEAGFVFKGFHVGDFDFDAGAGGDIGEALGEDVGALLIEEGGKLAAGFGLFVDLAGFGAAFDEALDDAVVDADGHFIDGTVGGEGEGVEGFEGSGEGVAEDLFDADAADGSGEVGGDGGVFEGAGVGVGSVRGDAEEGTGGGVLRGGFGRGGAEEREGRQGDGEEGDGSFHD